eukprot:278525_1
MNIRSMSSYFKSKAKPDDKQHANTTPKPRLRNNQFEWTHNELTKTILHPLAYGSNRYLDLKNLLCKAFKTIRSIKEVKFHSHKRKNYEAMDNNTIGLRHVYENEMKAHPPHNICKPSKDYKQWRLQTQILSSVYKEEV